MRPPTLKLTLIAAALALCGLGAALASLPQLAYPIAPRGNQVDDYHGTQVADPYRWLEDIDSPQARAWVESEGALARRYLDALPGRDKLTERVRAVWNYERWTPPVRHGSHWFYFHNDGLQNQNVLFVTDDPAAPGRILIDPNTLSKDGTVALRETAITDDGHLIAYSVSDAGSDWQSWHVRDVDKGVDRADVLLWSKDSRAPGARTARASTTRYSMRPPRRRSSRPPTNTSGSTSIGSTRRRAPIRSSIRAATHPTGSPIRPSPRMGAICWSHRTAAPT